MREMRMLVISEDYGYSCLVLTDCTNEQIENIIKKILENNENGVGVSIEKVCENLYRENTLVELGDTSSFKFDNIKELEKIFICSFDYLSVGVVSGRK